MAELAEAAVRLTATRLLRNLHVALLIIVSAILLALDLPKVLAPSLPFASLPIRLTYFLLLLTIVAVNGVLLATKRGWGPGLWLVLALVFAGYGLSIPEKNYDDLAGLDLKGKVAVIVAGAPAEIPGALAAHAQSAKERWAAAAARQPQASVRVAWRSAATPSRLLTRATGVSWPAAAH